MQLTLLPTPPEPVRAAPGRAELGTIWDGLDQEGRRLLLAQARAVAEVTGRVQQQSGDGH
ncbi:hypothetical protein [Roseomonas sp. KE2513]|uniref:hypothetical protein n=1 Tax=Roseomonas sp. KE2513 TaxID=2479202 RepID=UPI0018DF0C53|nr:hypothetical protein [Roseomonas sp. KE2513]